MGQDRVGPSRHRPIAHGWRARTPRQTTQARWVAAGVPWSEGSPRSPNSHIKFLPQVLRPALTVCHKVWLELNKMIYIWRNAQHGC